MLYPGPRRRRELAEPRRPLCGASDLGYLFLKACLDEDSWPVLEASLARIIDRYLARKPGPDEFAIVLGALDCARWELHRRVPQQSIAARHTIKIFSEDFHHERIAPLEDDQRQRNGDVI